MADDRISKNLHLVYSALKSEGYTDIGDEQDFIKKMQDEQNRLKVYNALKGAGYSDMGSDFKSFSGMIYTAPQTKPQPAAAPAASPQSSPTTIQTNVAQPVVQTPTKQQQPTSAAPREVKKGDGSMLIAPKQEQPLLNFNFTANSYHGVPVLQSDENGNPKVSGGKFNPVTGQYEGEGGFYTDWMGNKIPVNSDYGKAAVAYHQHVKDVVNPINVELEEAYKERDRINKLLSDRMREIDKVEDNLPWYLKIITKAGRIMQGDKMGGYSSSMEYKLNYNSDQQYRNIMSAARKNRAAIRALEDKKNAKQNEFWHSLGNAITNGYTFSEGDSQWGDVNALSEAQKHMPEIERKQRTGEKLTKDEEIAATVIKNHAWDNDVQQRYGDEYGAWASAGETAGGSLELAIEFLMMAPELKATAGSVMKLTEKGATKLLGKLANNGLGKFMTKATGVTLGSMVAGAEMSNTIGIGRTTSDVGKRYLGNVTVNEEDGSYQFDGGKSFMQSLYEAEMSAAIENGSEVLGEFLPGSSMILKGLQKVGMKKVANGLTRLGGRTWYKNYTKALESIGFHGVGGEAVEEYASLLGNALLVGDNKFSDLLDPRTHVDIWLGCAVTGGLLNAPRTVGYAAEGAHKGYQAAQYYRYKHKTDKADGAANAVWGDEWVELRDRIDGTSNEYMTDLATSIYEDVDMPLEKKAAALNYIGNLTAMRGYNMGRISMEREDENGRGTSDDERSMNNAYAAGYNATVQEDMEDVKNAYDMHRQLAENALDEWTLSALDGNETGLDGEPINPLHILGNMAYNPVIGDAMTDEQRKIAADYLNAKARYDGMLQRVRDGTVQVAWNGNVNNPQTVSKDFLQELSTNAAMARLAKNEQERAIQEELDKEDEFQQQRPTYNLNDEVTLRGENGEPIRGSITTEENEDGQIEVYTESPINGKKIHMFTRQQIDDMLMEHNGEAVVVPEAPAITAEIDNAGAVQSEPSTVQNDVENVPETTENVPNTDENVPAAEETVAVEPMPMVGEGEDAEPDFSATTPQRAHDYIFNESGLEEADAAAFTKNNVEAANKELEKIKNKKPKMGTSIAKFNKDKAEWEQKVNEAQAKADYWKQVKEARDKVLAQRLAEQQERERQKIEQAQADEAAYREEMARKEAEQAALGANNVSPAIRDKWVNAPKVEGAQDEIVLPNGEKVAGRYYLVESGAASASHDSNNGFAKTEGFPVDENGGSVNDRDYERDMDAQRITRDIANNYDSRAVQTPVVVSQDGVVLSGNGRTMAGELAAAQNTDAAYNIHIAQYPTKWGFTQKQVEGMQHPRVVFVPDAAMPYTAETFAKFNQQEMKGQSKTEQAVKLGKVVSDDSFKGIVRTINGYDTLGDFYNDADASIGALYDLHNAGVVPQAQLAEMVDGIRGQEKLSAVGREFLENMLIGKAFEGDPDVVRMLTSEPYMRQSVITALGEIADNIAIGGGWSLQQELADSVRLCFDARKEGAKQGDIVSIYAKQGVLFADPDQLQTVADFNNATMLMLADVLNDKRVTLLKTTLQLYNNHARESAAGQTDLFAGGIRSREDILRDVINFINNNYGKRKEIDAARAAAVERRKAESVQQNGTDEAGIGGSENTGGSGKGTEETPTLTHDEAISLIAKMEERANVAPEVELTIENWDAQFGEDGRVVTPIGEVKMGENQFTKLMRQGREGKLGMVKPTLETPDVIIEDASEAKDGDVAERKSSYVFVKAFKKADGSRYYYFTSVTVSKDGKEVVISNQEKRKNAIANLLTNGKLVWKHADDVSAASDVKQGLYSSQGNMSDPTTEGTDAPQTNVLSASKGKANSSTSQAKGEKVAENQSSSGVQAALEAAEQDTNTEPTEAQKQAGNYKKGHVKIDGFDVTIENPRGSVRSGKDADGKEWEQTMHNTYGYIRGTEGVDGDHIDVFFSEDPSHGDVFVVDQVNKDGNFDEHKVMYGFPDIESARKAYLANYEDGWTGLGAITPVSKEEFKKWIDSSHRKTKPFAEYSSVKPLGDTQLGEQPNKPTVKDGEDYVSAAERIAREDDVKRTAAHFAMETREEAAAFDRRVGEMSDLELLSYIKADGNGDVNKAHHPSVYDEYDYRHGDEQLQSYDATLVRLNESGTTLEQAEEMLANIRRDKSLLATDMRADLLGQEDALQDYIAGLEKPREKRLLSAYEKKETSEPANSRMDVESNLEGKSDDTATRQDSDVSGGKVRNNPAISQRNGVRKGGVDELVSDAMSIGVEDVASFPKEIREEDTISKEQNSGKRGDRIKVKAGLSGNDLYIQYKSGRSSKDKRRWATIKIPNATNYSAGQIIYRLGYIGTFTDIERLSGDAVLELFNKNGLRLQKGGVKDVSHREAALRDALVDVLRGAGVDVVTDVEEGQRVLDEANSGARMHAKKRALETASLSDGSERSLTVVSSADGAKVLINLDKAIQTLESSPTQPKTFVGDIANSLGAQRKGSKSEYATFETKNGRVVTIRLADHNATVSNFDRRGELDGISIVVSPKKSAGVTNDGEAHVVEYYYDAIKLRRADGKPLADIVRSIKQALYSGEFEDTTGLAERQEVNTDKVRFFRTTDGHAYGFTKDGKIYIDPRIATAETPIHEYSHLWAWAFRKANPKEWANIVELMKGTTLWEEVKQRYPELKTEDEIADEVLAHYSGRRGAERLRAERERIASGEGDVVEKAKAISALERVKDALKRFWKGVADWLGIHFTSAEEVADKVLADMLHGVNPVAEAGAQREGVRYEANSEEAEIVAKAKADGTYMKAPDGKPSRLSPRQWVQVRTRAFKEWFGDWEKRARIEKLRKSEPIVKKGDEYKGRYELNSRSAEDYVIKSLRGEYTNSDTGDVIKITRASRKVTHHDAENDVHLRSIAYIPDMIENAVFIEERPNENGAKFASYRYYVVGLKIGDVHYTAKLVVGRKNGESYYDHSLTEIEKNSLIDLTDGVKADVSGNETAYFSAKDKRLLSILQTNSSKVVYENGEPRVVYHQTNSTIFVNRETGENFDNLNWKEKDYWENEASEEEWNDTWEERDFYVFDNKTHGRRSVEMPAFFFSPVYDEYHEYGDRTVAAFLNIRNPIVNPDIPNRGVTDTAGEDAMNALIAQGYDGFIREYDGEVEEINAFFPNQIKCAEENVGTFDGSNPDIRYQFVGEKGASAMDKAEEASVRLDNLAVAREMEAAGKDAKAVKLATGWERGGDGKWRYEIEDGRFDRLGELHPERRRLSAAEQKELDDALSETDDAFEKGVLAYKEEITDDTDMADIYEAGGMERKKAERIRDLEDKQRRLKGEPKKLDDYLENDELFNAYPQLRDIVIDTSSEGDAVFGKMGSYVHASNTIRLNDTSLSTLTHEVQHAIQKIEGFARGGSVRDVRNRIRQRIAELDNVSEHAKEMLARQVEYRALASKLGRAYEMLMKNGEDWAVRAASDNYWEAMNTLDNDENSRLNNVYPKGKNASEIAKDGFNRDKAIEELNRLSDYYASQISAEDMKNIKDSEALSGKINGKSDEELYHALGGEVEARNVQSRLGMTAEERRASLASETEDVAREDQIFLNDLLGVSMSESASTDLEDVNRRFNDELGRLTDENKDKIVLSLGRPSDILLAAGVSEKPMKLYGNKVIKKMRKHGFALDELKDLPRAVADPIAVFDNIGREGNRSILTELRTEQGNFLVTVDLGKDADVDFNIVSSVFGKGSSNVIDWINKGLATYINKEKALAFLSHPSAPIAAAAANAELDSAAKVVKEFENPKVSDEDVSEDDAVYRIREDVQDSEQNDADMMRSVAEQMGEKLHTNIHIIEDVNEITHPNSAVQERRSRSKGWYDTKTGQVNIVLPNNRSVDDVKASVGHETIAHKGLRELIGEENYDAFLDEVYEHLRGDLKQQIDTQASRAFIDDATRNGERAKSYEQHRRTAVDELFGRLAAKPFEEFAEGERTLWQKIKEAVRKVLDEFLGTLKLPKWFELGDNELRYMLWRSKERLERGREHPIDLARDIVKREELGLTDEARYNMGDAPETFKARQRRAVENKGTVMPGLNGAQVKVVGNIPRHTYTGTIAEATQQAIDAAKAKYVPNGEPRTLHYNNFGAKFDYSISGNAIEIVLSAKHQGKSVNKGVHLALAEHLDRVIGESIEVEEHPDRLKTGDARDNGKINPDALMHRFYGVANIDGVDYRVMTLMKEENKAKRGNGIHSYEVQKIEVLDEETPNTSNGVGTLNSELEGYPLAKLIKDVGKTMETDKNLLDESKLADESTDLYREVGETDDIWSDGSLGLHERMTAAAARLSANHKDNKTLRNDAMRAIGSNLFDLRKAMSLQRTFDKITAKRVADLARVLMNIGHLSGLTQQEVKRLMAAIRDSVGRENIDESIQKIMDIMVDNQLKHAEATLHELESIKGSKVDARGVEVQGQLDPDGQTLIKAMKEAQKIVNPCGGKTHDEKGEPTAWGNALESAQMRISSKTISLMESG